MIRGVFAWYFGYVIASHTETTVQKTPCSMLCHQTTQPNMSLIWIFLRSHSYTYNIHIHSYTYILVYIPIKRLKGHRSRWNWQTNKNIQRIHNCDIIVDEGYATNCWNPSIPHYAHYSDKSYDVQLIWPYSIIINVIIKWLFGVAAYTILQNITWITAGNGRIRLNTERFLWIVESYETHEL